MNSKPVEDAFQRTARASDERWQVRVQARPLLAAALAGSTALALLFAFVDPLTALLPSPAVLTTLALSAALATSAILWLRHDLLDDERIGWVVPGHVAAGLLMFLSIQQVPGLGSPSSPLAGVTTAALNRAFGLHLVWHLAFAGAVLGGLLLNRRDGIRRLFLVGVLASGLLLATTTYPSQLDLVLVSTDGTQAVLGLTTLYWAVAAASLLLLGGTATAWFLLIGKRPPVARVWVGVSVALVTVEMAFQMLSVSISPRFLLAALVMQALAFVVSLGGQLLGLRRTVAGQLAFERDIARRHSVGTVSDGPGADADPISASITANDIRSLLRSRSLEIVLQPIVAIDDADVVGFEALSRFPQTALGASWAPDRWFEAADHHGLGVELELLAVSLGLDLLQVIPDDTYLSINLSPRSMIDDRIPGLLRGRDGRRLMIELTEHTPVEDYANLIAALDGLRALGVRVAVDDAGAGFSSLRHITQITPDVLKIDIGLVRDVHQLPHSRAMIAALVAYANRVGASLVAEGVESPEEARALAILGVPLGQGWHWSKALPVNEAKAFAAKATELCV